MKRFIQDSDSILDYTLDWSNWLVSDDTLAHAVFYPDVGLVLVSENNTSTTASCWIAGGAAGSTYNVTCHITTDRGRQDDRTFQLYIKET